MIDGGTIAHAGKVAPHPFSPPHLSLSLSLSLSLYITHTHAYIRAQGLEDPAVKAKSSLLYNEYIVYDGK